MIQSDEINEVVAALVTAKSQFKTLIRKGYNPHFKSLFADLSAINDATHEALHKNGLVVVQSLETEEFESIGVTVSTRLLHKSGQWIGTGSAFFPATKGDAQGCGSAATYGRRYQLSALLCLAADADDDGNAASAPAPKSAKSRAQALKSKKTEEVDNDLGF